METAPHSILGPPGAVAKVQVLYQEDVGPALLHYGFGVLRKSCSLSEAQFLPCEMGTLRGSGKNSKEPSRSSRK